MAYTRSDLEAIVAAAAKKNNFDLDGFYRSKLSELRRKLDNNPNVEEKDMKSVMDEIRHLFQSKFQNWDYKDIGNELSRKYFNKSIF